MTKLYVLIFLVVIVPVTSVMALDSDNCFKALKDKIYFYFDLNTSNALNQSNLENEFDKRFNGDPALTDFFSIVENNFISKNSLNPQITFDTSFGRLSIAFSLETGTGRYKEGVDFYFDEFGKLFKVMPFSESFTK